jgi:tRNA (adenine22-N1)-methyltransferase
MDVGEGPLLRAKEHIAEYQKTGNGISIQTRLSDGLRELSPGEADTVIIAGMGGELEIRILEEGKHMWDSVKNWILSPQSSLDKVRHFLLENGFAICDEAMIKDEGKFYTVMQVKRGSETYAGEAHYLYGKRLIEKKDETLKEYLAKEERRLKNILASFDGTQKEQRTLSQEKAVKALNEELSWVKEAQHEMQ